MKVSPSAIFNAIRNFQIDSLVEQIISQLRDALAELKATFLGTPASSQTLQLEQDLFSILLDAGRQLIERVFNSLDKAPEQQPATTQHCGNNNRRLEDRTVREIVTRFGKIKLSRSRYRQGVVRAM